MVFLKAFKILTMKPLFHALSYTLLGVQKEPQSVMVKSTKTNQRKGFSQWLHYMKNA